MTTIIDFTPNASSVFQFQATLDAQVYNCSVPWSLFGARFYLRIVALNGTVILYTALIGSASPINIASLAWSLGAVTVTTAAPHGVNPGLYRKLGFDAVKDFAGISLVATVPNVLVVNNNMPVKDVKELIAYLRANPGKVNFGSPGYGSTGHMSTELFMSMTGVKMNHVPYKGDAGVLADVMAGQVSLSFSNMPAYTPQIKAGRLRGLAVTTLKRSNAVPDLPTMVEAGVPDFDAAAWNGMMVPAKTPREIVNKLHIKVAADLRLPDVIERTHVLGFENVGSTPVEFAMYLRAELDKWARVAKATGAKAE